MSNITFDRAFVGFVVGFLAIATLVFSWGALERVTPSINPTKDEKILEVLYDATKSCNIQWECDLSGDYNICEFKEITIKYFNPAFFIPDEYSAYFLIRESGHFFSDEFEFDSSSYYTKRLFELARAQTEETERKKSIELEAKVKKAKSEFFGRLVKQNKN